VHSFNEADLRNLKRDEKKFQIQDEKDMEKIINFNKIVDGSRRIKKKTEGKEKK